MLNHAMFQRNGRCGYVLKPLALRHNSAKDLLLKRTTHTLDVTIISAQQLPHRRDAFGKEAQDKAIVDPYVEVTLYVPDWPVRPVKGTSQETDDRSQPSLSPTSGPTSMSTRPRSLRTSVVKKNGFNPVWEEKLSIAFDCVGDMFDLVFVKFVVSQEDRSGDEPLALYCAPLGSLQHGMYPSK
jgi:phosphatidylinositol phospholipase C delta